LNDGWEVFFRDKASGSDTVTHWQHLPTPPKQKCQCKELMRDSIDPELCAYCGNEFQL